MNAEVKNNRSKKGVAIGLIIIGIGVFLLLRKLNVYIPGWLFDFPAILIYVGVAIGISTKFKNLASWILISIGSFLLIGDFIPFQLREYFWPLAIIAVGVIVLLRPRKKKSYNIGAEFGDEEEDHTGFYSDKAHKIDSVSIFNGLKKRILSKKFRGGESVTIFGGTEINLLDADFEGAVELESVVIFGGLKLIVPPNWEVRTNVTSILGGVEDKRSNAVQVMPDDKVLILTGVVIFGGLDIVNY